MILKSVHLLSNTACLWYIPYTYFSKCLKLENMNKVILFLLLVYCSTIVYAQQPTYSKSELRIKALLDKGDTHYRNSNKIEHPYAKDSAFYYAKKAESLSLEQKNEYFLARAYILYAYIYDLHAEAQPNPDNYKKSLDYVNKAIVIFTRLKKDSDLCFAYRELLGIQEYQLPLDKTIELAEKTRELCKKAGEKYDEGKTLEDLAYYYCLKTQFHKGIEFCNEALKVYKSAKIDNVQTVYSFMGAVYNELGELDKALEYSLKAVALSEKYPEVSYTTIDLYNFTGVIYRDLKKYNEALSYFEKAVAMSKKINNQGMLSFYEANAAEVALLAGNNNRAKYHLSQIEKKDHLINDPQFINALITLTKSHIKLKNDKKADKYALIIQQIFNKYDATVDESEARVGFSSALMSYYFHKKEFDLCRKYTLIYKDDVSKRKSKRKIMNAYHMLFKIDSAQTNFKSALGHYKMEMLYKDSIFNEVKNKQLTELQVKYESDEKEKSNLLLKKQAELQQSRLSKADLMKNVGFAGIGILVLTVILLYRRYLINRRIKKVIDLKNETLQNIVHEKEWLLKEIHHRVKNNLQVVMSLLNTQSHYLQDESAKKAIKNSQNRIHSMSLIHKKLYQSNNIVSVNMDLYIHELVEYLKESLDTGQRICFEINAEPIELNSTQSVPLSLILNETIMNSIKHAFPDGREGIISINLISLPENRIRLTIQDNGIGYEEKEAKLEASSSLGIRLIQGFSGELNADLEFISNKNGNTGLTIIIEFTAKNINP